MEYLVGAAAAIICTLIGFAANIYAIRSPKSEMRNKNTISCAKNLDLFSFQCAKSIIETRSYESEGGEPSMTPIGLPSFDVIENETKTDQIDDVLYAKIADFEVRLMYLSTKINGQLKYVNPGDLADESVSYCSELGLSASSLARKLRDSIGVPNPRHCFKKILQDEFVRQEKK